MRSTSRGAGCGGDLLAVMAGSGQGPWCESSQVCGGKALMVPWYQCTNAHADRRGPANEPLANETDRRTSAGGRLPMSAVVPRAPRIQVRSFHLDAPRDRVFPLFTARGEREWATGWDPVMLSGGEERGSAFQTRNHAGQTTTWIVTDY